MNLVPDVINIAKKSQYLSSFDIYRGGLFGGGIDKSLPRLIYTVRKSVERTQELNGAFPDTKATATVTITSIGVTTDTITIQVNDPVLGLITLGTYVQQAGDTTTEILATNIAAELFNNGFRYAIAVVGSVITLTAPFGYGDTINGGNRLVVIDPSTSAVSATATFFSAGGLTSVSVGQDVIFAVEFPASTFTNIGTYQIQTGDNVASVLAANIAAALAGNSEGYVIQASGDDIINTAPLSLGAQINGLRFRATWNSGSNSVSVFFANGVDATGIGYTAQQFSGGVTATDGEEGLISASNYLYWLCGKYALISKGISGSGNIASITPDPSAVPNRYDFIVSGTSFIITGQSQKVIPEFIGFNVIFVRNGATQSTQDVGGTYYSWNSVTGLFQLLNGEAQEGETFTIIPTLA